MLLIVCIILRLFYMYCGIKLKKKWCWWHGEVEFSVGGEEDKDGHRRLHKNSAVLNLNWSYQYKQCSLSEKPKCNKNFIFNSVHLKGLTAAMSNPSC